MSRRGGAYKPTLAVGAQKIVGSIYRRKTFPATERHRDLTVKGIDYQSYELATMLGLQEHSERL